MGNANQIVHDARIVARNPRLSEEQLRVANDVLAEIRNRMSVIVEGDDDYYFALRRKVAKELTYDERGKPGHRKRLKKRLYALQEGHCKHCGLEMEQAGSVLDRREAKSGYTVDNVDLIHPACDLERQQAKGFTDDVAAIA